ncbi:MAG: enoyl-CoA hydratase/isomerase family protein, partial [Myxococcales bacterium]|nr:enoyl-CoA hydratase/isomerase family protein [Myxococcales bacterium]
MIKTQVHNGVGRLTLARPEKKNAFNGEMLQIIDATIAAFGSDDNVRVIVVDAEGETFCAGADLMWMAQYVDASRQDNIESARELG